MQSHGDSVCNPRDDVGSLPSIFVPVAALPPEQPPTGFGYGVNNQFYQDIGTAEEDNYVAFSVCARAIAAPPAMDGGDYDMYCNTPTDSEPESDCEDDSPLQVSLQKVPHGCIINSNVYLPDQHWHTLVPKDAKLAYCAVCDLYSELDTLHQHWSGVAHGRNLDRAPPARRYDISIVRKIKTHFHCGVCNELFDSSKRDDHFGTKMHEGNLLFAINKATDILYNFHGSRDQDTDNMNQRTELNDCENTMISENASNKDCYYFNINNIKDNESVSSDYQYTDNNNYINFKPDVMFDDFEYEEPEVPITGISYAKMAQKPKIEMQKFIEVDLDSKKVKVRFDSWHMIITPKANRFYCMMCKKHDHIRHKAEHCSEQEHLNNLDKCTVVEAYEEYFIRQVDDQLYHCGHCNNLQLIHEMEDHVESKHPRRTRLTSENKNKTDSADNNVKMANPSTPVKKAIGNNTLLGSPVSYNKPNSEVPQNYKKPIETDKKNLNEKYAKNVSTTVTTHQSANDQKTVLPVGKNQPPLHNPQNKTLINNSRPSNVKIFNNDDMAGIFDTIVIYPFNCKMVVPILSYNVVLKRETDFYCGLCDFICPNNFIKKHICELHHIELLYRTPFVKYFSYNLIRAIRESFHCCLCNIPVPTEKIMTHSKETIHVFMLIKCLKHKPKDLDSQNEDLISAVTQAPKSETAAKDSTPTSNVALRVNNMAQEIPMPPKLISVPPKLIRMPPRAIVRNNMAQDIQRSMSQTENITPVAMAPEGNADQGGYMAQGGNIAQKGDTVQRVIMAQGGNIAHAGNIAQGANTKMALEGNMVQKGNMAQTGNMPQVTNLCMAQKGNTAQDGNMNQRGKIAQEGNMAKRFPPLPMEDPKKFQEQLNTAVEKHIASQRSALQRAIEEYELRTAQAKKEFEKYENRTAQDKKEFKEKENAMKKPVKVGQRLDVIKEETKENVFPNVNTVPNMNVVPKANTLQNIKTVANMNVAQNINNLPKTNANMQNMNTLQIMNTSTNMNVAPNINNLPKMQNINSAQNMKTMPNMNIVQNINNLPKTDANIQNMNTVPNMNAAQNINRLPKTNANMQDMYTAQNINRLPNTNANMQDMYTAQNMNTEPIMNVAQNINSLPKTNANIPNMALTPNIPTNVVSFASNVANVASYIGQQMAKLAPNVSKITLNITNKGSSSNIDNNSKSNVDNVSSEIDKMASNDYMSSKIVRMATNVDHVSSNNPNASNIDNVASKFAKMSFNINNTSKDKNVASNLINTASELDATASNVKFPFKNPYPTIDASMQSEQKMPFKNPNIKNETPYLTNQSTLFKNPDIKTELPNAPKTPEVGINNANSAKTISPLAFENPNTKNIENPNVAFNNPNTKNNSPFLNEAKGQQLPSIIKEIPFVMPDFSKPPPNMAFMSQNMTLPYTLPTMPHMAFMKQQEKVTEKDTKLTEKDTDSSESDQEEFEEEQELTGEEQESMEQTFDSMCSEDATFDVEEYVYLKLKNSYIKVSNTSYNTLVAIGDGSRYCFVCSEQVQFCELQRHVDSRSHLERLESYRFLDKYEDHLLRQNFLMYHCAICNVIVTRKELKTHIEWPPHTIQNENTYKNLKMRKNEIKGGVKHIVVSVQKEDIYLNEHEPPLKVYLNARVNNKKKAASVKSDGVKDEGLTIPKKVEKKNKIIIFNDMVVKVPWESWNGVYQIKSGYKCILCQRDLKAIEVDTHCDGEWHKYSLVKQIDKQYAPAFIRMINESTLNCVTCNTELPNKRHLVAEHVSGKKHVKMYRSIHNESSEATSYNDCDEDVFNVDI